MTTPNDRQFVVFQKGVVRDDILAMWREGIRGKIDPETGLAITEARIRTTTQPSSRFYVEADSLDLVGLAIQQRAQTMANNIRIDGANSKWLQFYHADQWGQKKLPATGGSGAVDAKANAGVIWQGSTTVPDEAAVQGTDPAGNTYQVFISAVTPANGEITLTIVGVTTGEVTNLEDGTEIVWVNAPVGAQPEALVNGDLTGGTNQETDQDFVARLKSIIRKKPGSGNNSQIRTWARQASNAVEEAFVYACALHAGSTLVSITQKRANVQGPLARIPSLATLQVVTDFLVPPGSSVVPERVFLAVLTPNPISSDMVLSLVQQRGSAAGWTDTRPWPTYDAAGIDAPATVTAVTDQLTFRITTEPNSLPGGVFVLSGLDAPAIMVWDLPSSTFEVIQVSSVTDIGGGVYDIVLSAAADHTIEIGDFMSPDMGRRAELKRAVESYYDGRGPGELINLDGSDVRATRAFRTPTESEGFPKRAGQDVITDVISTLGGAATGAVLQSATPNDPGLPADPIDGPNMLVLGNLAVYELI